MIESEIEPLALATSYRVRRSELCCIKYDEDVVVGGDMYIEI